ncbi:MAG: hypothetical protein IIX54_00555 [Clostridia bacterium]|nr:hypothetical protein [Clostridia bacterium]
MNKKLLPEIYNNFDAFNLMCLSTTLMSSYNCEDFNFHAHQIINFIGKAFKLDGEMLAGFEDCILGDMMNIGLITDYHAIASVELLSETDKENIELYEIKGRVLEQKIICEAQNFTAFDMRVANQIKSNMKYEYFHHPYNAKFRFWQLNQLVKNGNVDITRQLGILYALGIGCQQNTQKAEEYFLKCFLWGDTVSAVLLGELYEDTGIKNEYKNIYFQETVSDQKVLENIKLMKLLNAYIIAPQKNQLINTELAKVLISGKISYKNKVELIVNWNEQTWRNLYRFISEKEKHIGFRVSKNE